MSTNSFLLPGERPVKCEFEGCDYATTQKSNLKVHMRKHTGERPFPCTFPSCTHSSTQKSALTVHMLQHKKGKKPFQCSYEGCDYDCASKEKLRVHTMGKHTNERPFRCIQPGCNFATTTKNCLMRHEIRHLNKPEAGVVAEDAATPAASTRTTEGASAARAGGVIPSNKGVVDTTNPMHILMPVVPDVSPADANSVLMNADLPDPGII